MIMQKFSPEMERLIRVSEAARKSLAEQEGQSVAMLPLVAHGSYALCLYLAEEPLLSGRVAELGLSVVRQWRKCSHGFGVKGLDGNGYICGCEPWPNGGCTGCDSYNADVSQSPDEVESGEPDGG